MSGGAVRCLIRQRRSSGGDWGNPQPSAKEKDFVAFMEMSVAHQKKRLVAIFVLTTVIGNSAGAAPSCHVGWWRWLGKPILASIKAGFPITKGVLLETAELLLFLINPLPFHVILNNRRWKKIRYKIYVDPDVRLSQSEMTYVAKHQLEEKVNVLRLKSRRHPWLIGKRERIIRLMAKGPGLYALALALLASKYNRKETVFQYFSRIRAESRNSVDVVLDYTYFPHLAVRVGRSVYSFSKRSVQKYDIEAYFFRPVLHLMGVGPQASSSQKRAIDREMDNDIKALKARWAAAGSPGKDKAVVLEQQKSTSAVHMVSGDDRAGTNASGEATSGWTHRTFLVIRLNLSDREVDQIKSVYEDLVDKSYFNVTFANDCSSMALDILGEVTGIPMPHWLSVVPGAVQAHLKILKMSGNKKIGDVVFVAPSENLNSGSFHIRNAYITTIEARLHVLLTPFVYVPVRYQLWSENLPVIWED